MKSKRIASKGKKINPHFWVFCEGETEEAYIRFLRSEYRLPIEIIPKIAGCDVSELLKAKLRDKCSEACSRSKRLTLYRNPSTNMHDLIEAIKNVKNI